MGAALLEHLVLVVAQWRPHEKLLRHIKLARDLLSSLLNRWDYLILVRLLLLGRLTEVDKMSLLPDDVKVRVNHWIDEQSILIIVILLNCVDIQSYLLLQLVLAVASVG